MTRIEIIYWGLAVIGMVLVAVVESIRNFRRDRAERDRF